MELISKNSAVLSILFTKNNIFCTFSNLKSKTLNSISIGSKKKKGLKKTTSLTIFLLIRDLNKIITQNQIIYIYLKLKGTNKNKNLFFKNLKNIQAIILCIQNKNKIAYGGCRLAKKRKI